MPDVTAPAKATATRFRLWPPRSLASVVLITLLIIAIVPLLGLGKLITMVDLAQREAQVTSAYAGSLELGARELSLWLLDGRHELTRMAQQPDLLLASRRVLAATEEADPAAEAARQYLIQELKPRDQLAWLMLLDPSGTVVAATLPEWEGRSLVDQEFYADGGALDVSGPLALDTAGGSGASIVFLTTPILAQDGLVAGSLAGALTTQGLATFLLGPSGEERSLRLWMLDDADRIVASWPPQASRDDPVRRVAAELRANLADGFGSARYRTETGQRMIGAVRLIPELRATLWVEQSEEEAFAASRLLSADVFRLVIALVVIVGIASLLVSRVILRPVAAMTATAEAFASGELARRMPIDRRDELGALAAAFNVMAERIQVLVNELEARVRERTDALSETSATLRRKMEIVDTAVDQGPLLIDYHDADGRFVGANQMWQEVFGWDLEETKGRDMLAELYPDPSLRKSIREFIREAPHGWRDSEMRTRDGRTRVVSWANVHLSDGTTIGLGQDVTEKRRIEVALQRRLALEQMVVGVSTRFINLPHAEIDAAIRQALREISEFAGADAGIMFFYDHEADLVRRQFGWYADPGDSLCELPATWSAAELPTFWLALGTQGFLALDASTTLGLGNEEELAAWERIGRRSVVAVAMRLEGRVFGALSLFKPATTQDGWSQEDIALLQLAGDIFVNALERQRTTRALEQDRQLLAERVAERTSELQRANKELARANRLKDEFLANVSHELRTPLNAIMGISEALLMGRRTPLPPDQAKQIQTVYTSGQHLLSLINDILDLSKIEAGYPELRFSRSAVDELCAEGLKMIRPAALAKNLSVSLEIAEPWAQITADQRRVCQVLVNLLSNAVKFTPEGGSMGLSVRSDGQAKRMGFTVWDTGIGIPADQLPLVD